MATVESLAVELSDSDFDYKVKEVVNESAGMTPLPEAELVVSAGRGMKGPENWGIIEELAGELGATTACSRPVADIGWRPHHEHVGQTGIAIKPNPVHCNRYFRISSTWPELTRASASW